jgi:hypothetical protein
VTMERQGWVQDIGVYWYYALWISGFDLDKALLNFDKPADMIAEAVVSKRFAEYVAPPKKDAKPRI